MSTTRPSARRTQPTWRTWRTWMLAALLLLAAAWVLWQAQRTLRSDWGSWAAREHVVAWASGALPLPGDAQLDATRDALADALDLMPDSPVLQERLGDAHFVAALQTWGDTPARTVHLQAAATQYRTALALRPGEPQTWAMLATVLQGAGAPADQVQPAWSRAHDLGPHDEHVLPLLMRVVLADWTGASPQMQDWAKALFDNGSPATRKGINTMAARYGLRFDADDAPQQ